MWDSLVAECDSIEEILSNKGLAQIGDNLVNFCYSLAKSVVLGTMAGEKVRDSILARAIRATSLYQYMRRRTDVGKAADAYEAIMAWLWMKNRIEVQFIVQLLVENLSMDAATNRVKEGEIASSAFQKLLEEVVKDLPVTTNSKKN